MLHGFMVASCRYVQHVTLLFLDLPQSSEMLVFAAEACRN